MKSVEERKADIERIFSAIGVKPVDRRNIGGEEVFIADGFIPPAMIDRGYLMKFQVNPGEFPLGAYMTLAWTERYKGTGSIGFFDAFHDPQHSKEDKAMMRVNAIAALAAKWLKSKK